MTKRFNKNILTWFIKTWIIKIIKNILGWIVKKGFNKNMPTLIIKTEILKNI